MGMRRIGDDIDGTIADAVARATPESREALAEALRRRLKTGGDAEGDEMKRKFWWVRMSRDICVEAPDGMTARTVAEALHSNDEWAETGEAAPGPIETVRPEGVRVRIGRFGKLHDCEPLEAVPDDAWYEWRGREWASDGDAMYARGVAPLRPRGRWLVGVKTDAMEHLSNRLGTVPAYKMGEDYQNPGGALCRTLATVNGDVIIDRELFDPMEPFVAEWLCGGAFDPVAGMDATGSMICILMPQRKVSP
jgi:hypothetical protein